MFVGVLTTTPVPFFWETSQAVCLDFCYNKWDKVFESGISKFYGRQPLKNMKEYGLLKPFKFLKAVFHKIYLVHSWIICLKYF